MNQLATTLQSAGLDGSPESIRATLAETVELSRDSTAYTWSGVNQRLLALGVDPQIVAGWDAVVTTLPGGTMLDRMLTSGGVDFTGPVIRGSLAAIAEGTDNPAVAAVLQALLAIGITEGPRYQQLGLEALPSEDEIAAALVQLANVAWIESTLEPLVASLKRNGGTLEETKAAIAEAVK